MPQPVGLYAFEKISSDMSKIFGSIKKGEEESYVVILQAMESNMLKVCRNSKINNGRRAIEAIRLCLFNIEGYLSKKEYDLEKYKSDENMLFVKALLMSCDPFVNPDVMAAACDLYALDTAEGLAVYFETPVRCLVRLEKSAELWTKEQGVSGYFSFLEETMGKLVPWDDKMDMSVEIPK